MLSLKEMQYVEAARGLGASHKRLMFRHILPQCVAPYLILATTHLGVAIVIEASLGFLGVGIPPPTPTWGNMLSDALNAGLVPPWWLVLFPGGAITLTVLAFNLLGDGIRDMLDPRLRDRSSISSDCCNHFLKFLHVPLPWGRGQDMGSWPGDIYDANRVNPLGRRAAALSARSGSSFERAALVGRSPGGSIPSAHFADFCLHIVEARDRGRRRSPQACSTPFHADLRPGSAKVGMSSLLGERGRSKSGRDRG